MNTESFAKLIVGALYSDPQWLEQAKVQMRELEWNIQHQSLEFPFDQTDYYAIEMGNSLKRCFLSMEGVKASEFSADWKLRTLAIENRLSRAGKRRINLDPGYLDLQRVVLLSGKEGPQKIYLRNGVWADLVLLKDKGGYRDLPWTFPDLRDGRYNDFLLQVRAEFKAEIFLRTKVCEV